MIPSLMPGDFICSFLISGFKASSLCATLLMTMRVFAKLILLIYGLSIAGYVLLDATHEVLHQFKNSIHHHEHDHHHSHSHHHIDDHQVMPEDTDGSKNIVIYYFHLFFQNVEVPSLQTTEESKAGVACLVFFENPTFPPLTPPPTN